jgi:hypothetical protein
MQPGNYGAVSEPPVERAVTSLSFSTIVKRKDFLILALAPTIVFVVTLTVFTYRFLTNAWLCGLIAAVFLVIGGSIGAWSNKQIFRPTGFSFFPAVAFGVLAGLYVFDSYAIFPMFYQNTQTYRNVVPSQPGLAVADAGKIVFSTESFVETRHAISYIAENGNTYCVAPINDKNNQSRMEYWAAGMNCCGNGEFTCDAAQDPAASAGIVVFDNNGYFEEARHDYYDKARMKAESTYQLLSVLEPMYVRWVQEADLDMLSTDYGRRAFASVLTLTLVYLAQQSLLAYACVKQFSTRTRVTKSVYDSAPIFNPTPEETVMGVRERELHMRKEKKGCGACC